MKITVDSEEIGVVDTNETNYGMEINLEDGREFIVFPSAAEAGREARRYWKEMAENDPQEIVCLVGTDVLVAWALGQWAGPGSVHVTCLSDWLDLFLDAPAEEWNRQDGSTEYEIYIEPGSEAADAIGFDGDAVAYEM